MTANLGVVIYPMAQPIDIIGPWEVLSFWKNILHGKINLHLIAEKVGDVVLDNDITVKSHLDFAQAPQLDYLFVPGGRGRVPQAENSNLIHFIQKQAAGCQKVLSVCTGMFLLAKAGLLKDHAVNTYWLALPEFRENYPDIKVSEERIVKSGKIWTSGGVTSGIDLALAFIAEVAGKETAGQVQLLLEYFPKEDLYCSLKTVDTLPPYMGKRKVKTSEVPAYIKKHFKAG